MTTSIALDGPWDGLRAFPRGFSAPDTRRRMEAALERLQHHRDRFARHARRAQMALDRIDGLSFSVIAQLDAVDGDADLEPEEDLGLEEMGEPSLSASHYTFPSDQSGERWIGGGGSVVDAEGEHDGREPDTDDEYTLGASELEHGTGWGSGGCDDLEPSLAATHEIDQRLAWTAWSAPAAENHAATFDREEQCEDEGHDSDREASHCGLTFGASYSDADE